MSITYGGAGAWAAGSTSVTPALPATPNSNRRHILFVGCKPFGATINTPAGWTALAAGSGTNGSVANAIDLGSVRWAIFWRVWQSGDAAPTVSVTEALIAAICLKHGFVPGTLNCERVDSTLRSHILRENEARPIRRVLSNIFGFGGNNCSLVLGVL